MMTPLISIIIPCYNQDKFLDEALQSVLNQSYTNWECIVVNDGSTDNSESIAKNWTVKDSRFRCFHKTNSGVSATRNYALDKVKGDYIQFLDADDVIDKYKLELSLSLLEKSNVKNEKMVISNFRMFSNNQNKTTEPYCNLKSDLFTYENLLYKWNETFSIPLHCGFFEASLFDIIRFPENLSAQEDWIVWVKIFKMGTKAIFLNEVLAFYRRNSKGRTSTRSLHDDQLIVYENFKSILREEEYYKLSKVLISRYYKSQEIFKIRLIQVKNSNSYQTGLMIKKVLKGMGLLKISRRLMPLILKLRTKN